MVNTVQEPARQQKGWRLTILGYWLIVVGLTASFLGMRAVHPSISEYIGEAGGWVTLLALVPLAAAVWVSPLLKSGSSGIFRLLFVG